MAVSGEEVCEQHDQGTGGPQSGEIPLAALLRAGGSLGADLDLEALMLRILDAARDAAGARLAALGLLDERRERLTRFIASGIDESARRAIGDPPRGLGVLGLLIAEPRALRLARVSEHPLSCGLPQGHPPIGSFMGVPIMVGGAPWANLYLAEKQGAPAFTDGDEAAITMLAAWSGSAIANARRHEASERRSAHLERVAQAWEATREITAATGDAAGLERVLELIVKRGRALLSARCVLLLLRHGDELVLEASAGQMRDPRRRRLPISRWIAGQALQSRRPLQLTSLDDELAATLSELGVRDAASCLILPMLHRGSEIGVLCAFEATCQEADEATLDAFATSAAGAIAIARIIDADRRHGQPRSPRPPPAAHLSTGAADRSAGPTSAGRAGRGSLGGSVGRGG